MGRPHDRTVRWVGALAAALARAAGARTSTSEDGLRVCVGGRRLHGRGGTTFGDAYLTRDAGWAVSPARLAHERVHVEQWRRHGPLFPLLYVLAGTDPCRNRFEVEAGLASGGYDCPPGVLAAGSVPARHRVSRRGRPDPR